MTSFIDNAVLDPELIKSICSDKIDKNFIASITRLMHKLNYIKECLEPDSAPVRELQPEIIRLKNLAARRIRKFLM